MTSSVWSGVVDVSPTGVSIFVKEIDIDINPRSECDGDAHGEATGIARDDQAIPVIIVITDAGDHRFVLRNARRVASERTLLGSFSPSAPHSPGAPGKAQ